MKFAKKLLCLLLCLSLCLGLAACRQQEEAPSESETEEAFPTPAPTAEPSPEPTVEPTPFVPASDLIPTESRDVPDAFEDAFSQNSIDKQYDADYAIATSFSMMQQACDDAARRWRTMVSVAYDAALETVDAGETADLREKQEAWLDGVEARVSVLQEESGDDFESLLNTAKQIVLLYRDRAKELCKIKFEADGTLPEFPVIEDGLAQPAG